MSSKSKTMDAQWVPIKTKPTALDLAKDCAKGVGLYAALNLVLFYWQQAELLADEAAVPAMWVCALMAGVAIGKCVVRGCE